jgi:hypothetical protein
MSLVQFNLFFMHMEESLFLYKEEMYYGMASSVCLDPVGRISDQTASSGSLDHHNERKMHIVCQGQSMASPSRKICSAE